jgi:membrane-associated phospholipid phosphatase
MTRYAFVDYATQGYCALVGLLILFFHNHSVPHWPWLVSAHVLTLIIVHCLVLAQARLEKNRLLAFLRYFYPVLLYAGFFCETGNLNQMFVTHYLDAFTIRADQAFFGFQPGATLMLRLPWLALSEILYAAYFSYYIMIAGVGLALLIRNRDHFLHYISVVSFIFYLCYLTYIFLPIIGPQVLAHEIPAYRLPIDLEHLAVDNYYPDSVQSGVFFKIMAWIYRVFESPGSAFPSSHVAIAVCTLYFSFRYLRPIRHIHLVAVILLCISTVYCHYHYGVDVLGGLLAAAILIPLANYLYRKSCPPILPAP